MISFSRYFPKLWVVGLPEERLSIDEVLSFKEEEIIEDVNFTFDHDSEQKSYFEIQDKLVGRSEDSDAEVRLVEIVPNLVDKKVYQISFWIKNSSGITIGVMSH